MRAQRHDSQMMLQAQRHDSQMGYSDMTVRWCTATWQSDGLQALTETDTNKELKNSVDTDTNKDLYNSVDAWLDKEFDKDFDTYKQVDPPEP